MQQYDGNRGQSWQAKWGTLRLRHRDGVGAEARCDGGWGHRHQCTARANRVLRHAADEAIRHIGVLRAGGAERLHVCHIGHCSTIVIGDSTDLMQWLGEDHDVVRVEGGDVLGEGEGTVVGQGEVVAAVVLQHHAGAGGQTAEVSDDAVGIKGAGHLDIGDIGRSGATAVFHRAGLLHGLCQNRDGVGSTLTNGLRENKVAIGRKLKIIAAVVLQDQAVTREQTADAANDGVGGWRVVSATDGYAGDIGALDGASSLGNAAGLAGGLGEDGDVISGLVDQTSREGERPVVG